MEKQPRRPREPLLALCSGTIWPCDPRRREPRQKWRKLMEEMGERSQQNDRRLRRGRRPGLLGGALHEPGEGRGKQLTVAMITHGQPGDTFWDIIRKGAQAAAVKDNVKLIYLANPTASGEAQL